MKVTLIQENSVHFTVLSEDNHGEYYVMHTAVNGKDEELVCISQNEKGRVLQCGRESYICAADGKDDHRIMTIADDPKPLRIGIRRTGEKAILLFGDDSSRMSVFKKYHVLSNFTIGSGEDCDVCVQVPLMPAKACEIIYDGKEMHFKEFFREVRSFINGERVSEKTLKPGDLIFIYGFSIVIGKGFAAFNLNPKIKINSLALSEMAVLVKDESEVEHYFDEHSQADHFTVAPRFMKHIERVQINIENAPEPEHDKRPAVLSLGPSFTMGVSSAVTGMFTVINGLNSGRELSSVIPSIVMSASMLASSMIWPVISRIYENAHGGNVRRGVLKGYIKYLDEIRERIESATSEQCAILRERFPTREELAEIVDMRSIRLWEKLPEHDDYLSVSIGRGSVAPELDIIYKEKDPISIRNDVLSAERDKLIADKPIMKDAPVVVSLLKNRNIGIVGERSRAIDLARAMIIQLAALHSYKLVKIALIYDKFEKEEWRFLRWLPHLWNDSRTTRYAASDIGELKALSSALESVLNGEKTSDQHFVVICASRSLGEKSDLLTHLIGNEGENCFSTIILYDEYRYLPKECSAIIDLGDENVLKTPVCTIRGFSTFEDGGISERLTGTLANTKLHSGEGEYSMPSVLTFLELYGVNRLEELNCSARWADNNPVNSLAAPIGVDSHGEIISLDMHQDFHGPHGLIAGTTGSGKSEFIMTLILSLAVNYSPRDISFLLIDYKGGGMAAAFEKLPHTAGIITNLDGAEISRSMVVIKSEMLRRQAIFLELSKKVGSTVNDIYTYQRICRERSDVKPLSHLFIISDEFAELKKQEPEFMDGLISAARIGRSLGIHLILATQKPSGVVNAEIWSNSKFKICLKVQDREDSTEVIRRPDAATLTKTGRFYMQVGFNEIFELGQSAWAGAYYDTDGNSQSLKDSNIVSVIDNAGRVVAQARPVVKRNKDAKKQLEVITDYLTDCAASSGLSADMLWLPVMPDFIDVAEQEESSGFAPNERFELVMGLIDIPEKQAQETLTISAADGNILLYGMEGAGKTDFLITYIYGILKNYSPKKASVYILDFAGETLGVFGNYSGVGAFLTASKDKEIKSLFEYLEREIMARRTKLADKTESFLEYSAAHDDMPLINVVISNYNAFKESYEDYDPKVETLSREGQRVGIIFVLTTLSTTSLRFRLTQNFKKIFAMKLMDNSYSSVLGGTDGKRPGKWAGRGLLKHPEYGFVCEFQTAFVSKNNALQFIKENADKVNALWKGTSAFKIRRLPEIYTALDAEEYRAENDPLNVPIALEERFCEPVYADLSRGITLLLHNGAYTSPIIDQIAEYAGKCVKTIVLAADGNAGGSSNYEFVYGDALNDKVKELYLLVLSRCKEIDAAKKANAPVPNFSGSRVLVIINGYADVKKLIISLCSGEEDVQQETNDMLKRFKIMLEGVTFDCGVTFVIGAKAHDLHGCSDDWFVKCIRPNTFMWIGSGLQYEDFFKHEKISEKDVDFGSDLGYLVTNGKAQMIKFMNKGNY